MLCRHTINVLHIGIKLLLHFLFPREKCKETLLLRSLVSKNLKVQQFHQQMTHNDGHAGKNKSYDNITVREEAALQTADLVKFYE